MSDDSDVNSGRIRRKRNALIGDNSDSSIETTSRKRRRRKHRNYVRESDAESDSSIEIERKKKRVHRVVASDSDASSSSSIIKTKKNNVTALLSESDASSSGSEVIRTKKTISALVSDSEESNGSGSDSESEYDSDWVTEPEPESTANKSKSEKEIENDGAASDSSDGQTEKCPICLLPFKTQEVASPESCDHCFCVDCILEWSKNVNTCPVDRQTFNLILVRKNYNGKVVKQIAIDSPQQQNEVDEIVEDPTFCEICGRCDREDRMLLCDGCDLGYHLECLTPPLAEIPVGAWFCADCGPEIRIDDPLIDIYEVHLLLEDAETLGWPIGPRRRNTAAPRLVPRTRQTERVRARIITHRNQRRDDRHHEHNETLQSSEAAQNIDQPGPSTSSSSSSRNRTSPLTSVKRTKKRSYKKRKKRKPNIKITYEIDEATGEKIAVQTKIKRRRKRKRTRKTRSERNRARCVARGKTVKKRLAVQLGMCPPKANQTLPDIRIQQNSSSIGLQRSRAGIPALHLFGQRHELDYFSHSDSEHEDGGEGVNFLIRRRPQLSDASILRRAARRKSVIVPQVTSTSNILDSILDSQSKFHSKNTVLSLNKDGTVIVDKSNCVKNGRDVENNLNMANRNANVNRNRINLNNYNNAHARQTPMYGNSNATNEGIPIYSNTTDFIRRSSSESQAVSTSSAEAVRPNRLNNDADRDPNYLTQTVCSSYDSEQDNKKDKDKDKSRSNTPATHSDSEFDIYSDIETVSTSRAEESDIKAPPSPPRLGTPNTPTDEDANNSDVDLVIDTEKAESEKFDDSKEQVSSTVDSTGPTVVPETISSHAPHSTCDVQHEMVQSSGQRDNRGGTKHIDKDDDDDDDDDDNDEDSEDGCPNFSIYSTESIKLAKNTDLQLLNDNSLSGLPVQSVNTSQEIKDKYKSYNSESENQVGTSIYSNASFMTNSLHNETVSAGLEPSENALSSISDNEKENDEAEVAEITSKARSKSKFQLKTNKDKPVGLYSDSEDENLIKINHDKPFGIGDLRNMTEDISEEERSYTPCLDEKAPVYKQGLEGLETELISDEDRNDFDESHELKTISEGDALEINAKESELDFTKPEDYEEGEIVDKLKAKLAEEESKKLLGKEKENAKESSEAKIDDRNKENEADNVVTKEASSFKKLSKNTKERNYRDKDKGDKERDRSKSREKKDKTDKESRDKKKKEKRKELERYNVRSMIADKPRRVTKDKFGRELRGRRSDSKSSLSLTPPRRSLSRELRRSRSRSRKRRARSKPQRSITRSRSPEQKRSRSPRAKKRKSLSREKTKPRRKSPEKSKNKLPKETQTRHKSRSVSPRRRREFGSRRHSRGWSRSLSRSLTPPEQRLTPSWTPPRLMETQPVRPRNLTVILNNDLNKKKKEKKKKEKRPKELEKPKRRKKDRTPPPSKEVFASGNNILVSVSFNKDNVERDVSKRKRDCVDEISTKRTRKEKEKRKKDDRRKKRNQAVSGLKPVAIIDLERSPFREIIPAAEDVIVLTDSENGESNDLLALQAAACDSSQQVVSPEISVNTNYLTGPKTPPEPQVKFSLTAKQPQLRAIINPLHEPDDLEGEIDPQEELEQRLNESLHKGPNTPPEPPNSPPSSPDVYDPFDPTKSRSPTPEQIPQTVQSSTSQNDNTRDESLMDSRNDDDLSTLTDTKSHTPPVVTDIQPADSQSNIKATTPEKSPELQNIGVIINQVVQSQASIFPPSVTSKSLPTFSTASSMITSTPLANLGTTPRINIINSTIITPATVASAVPQRIVLPNTIKSSPVKVSPNKLPIKSTPIKPMPVKNLINKSSLPKRKRNQENADVSLDFDSPYSPGSSDYEDLFEPPPDAGIKKPPPQQPSQQTQKNTKSPAKMQSAFDTLFGSSPVNSTFKNKNNNKNEKPNKHKKNVKGSKLVGVKIDEDTLKILDELPNSAVEMQVKDKYLKKLNRQERVVDEVKLVLKPHYNKKHINKEEYKDILRRAVPKICHNKSGEINPKKIQNLIEAYVKKIRHSKKVTSSSSSMNPQKA